METSRKLEPHEVEDIMHRWQNVPQVDLPGIFYAFNQNSGLNERVISFKMSGESLGSFLSFQSLDPTSHLFQLYLGKNELNPNNVNHSPPFEPVIQFIENIDGRIDDFENCWSMEWDSEADFLQRSQASNFSSQISSVGAYSFVYEWCQVPYNQIASKFEGFTGLQVCRVRLNRFDASDVNSIISFYNDKKGEGDLTLFYHIGMGTIGNPFHPFIYSPILEIHFKPNQGSSLSEESLFFEFSYPCPPNCNQGGGST